MKIAIVGQGVLGSLIAYFLSLNQNYKLTLYDKGGDTSASNTAAGMLAPFTELEKSPPIICELGLASLPLWPQIIKSVNPNLYFKQNGTIVVSHAQDKNLQNPYLFKINKACQTAAIETLDQDSLARLEPELTQFNAGYFFEKEGQIDNQTLMQSLFNYLINMKNITVRPVLVETVSPYQVIAQNKREQYDWVIDVRGVGDKINYSDLRGVRGEVVWLFAEAVNLTRPIRLLHPRYSLYVVPRPNQHYIIGSTEIEANDTSPISVLSMLELLSAATSIHKGFYESRIIKTATALRPTLSNGEPQIKVKLGLLAANGLYRHGFLIAPMVAKLIADHLFEQTKDQRFLKLWEIVNDHCYF